MSASQRASGSLSSSSSSSLPVNAHYRSRTRAPCLLPCHMTTASCFRLWSFTPCPQILVVLGCWTKQMNGWMTRSTKHWETTDAFRRFSEVGGEAPRLNGSALVAQWLHICGSRGADVRGGGCRNREVQLTGPYAAIMDINNIHTEPP